MSSMVKSVSFAVPPDTASEEDTERTPQEVPGSPHLFYNIICPPLRDKHAKPPVRYQVYGYAMTMFEIRDWAIKRKFREDMRPPTSRRINPAIKEIRRRLPYKYKPGFDFVQVMDYDKDEVGLPCLCFYFGSNASEDAIQQAKRKDLTKQFQDVLGVTGMPKWYTPFSLS